MTFRIPVTGDLPGRNPFNSSTNIPYSIRWKYIIIIIIIIIIISLNVGEP
jgi:hypothetical protein